MKAIRRVLIIVLCVLILWVAYRLWQPNRKDKALESAKALYSLFIPYDFDSHKIAETDHSVILLEVVPPSESTPYLTHREVLRLPLTSEEWKHISRFKHIQNTYDGMLFATTISWNAEWRGVFITESELPSKLEKYTHEILEPGIFWFDFLPDHVIPYAYKSNGSGDRSEGQLP